MTSDRKTDRYVSFIGIEGDMNARRLIEMLRVHIDDPLKTNRFWEIFKSKLQLERGQPQYVDELYLIHAYINNIRELLELYDDRPALALLEKIELESC